MEPRRSIPFSVDLGIAALSFVIGIAMLLLILMLALTLAGPRPRASMTGRDGRFGAGLAFPAGVCQARLEDGPSGRACAS
jgi:hypothetical protein